MINVMGMKKAGEATKENIYNLFKYTKYLQFYLAQNHLYRSPKT